jgi:hypothetical protein
MGTVVTVISSASVRVTNETIKDRERFPNGVTELDADEEGTFIVSDKQSLRIEAFDPPEADEQPATEG